MAAKSALPFMLSKQADNRPDDHHSDEMIERIQAGRSRSAGFSNQTKKLAS